ncbi:MAG: iron-containing alcohol dehydrogenase [Bacteroidales bacterium]
MVKPFSFSRLPLIYFGTGKINLLSGLAAGYGKTILAITGASSFNASLWGREVFIAMEKSGLKIIHTTVCGEPSPAVVDRVVSENVKNMPDVVVAIGGGSAIDTGKAVSAMLPLKEGLRDYLEGIGTKEHPGVKVPFIAVPTTAGTGSEATKNAVISEVGPKGFKKSLRHENLMPDIAIVDPLLTVTCTPEITAATGMDCFTQLTEAYLSNKANQYTDALALEGLKAVKLYLLRAFNNGEDIEARTGMSFAALTSGICLTNAGLGTVHGFASSIGAMFAIPHGIVCGTLMAKANEVNVRVLKKENANNIAIEKYSLLGEIFLDKKGKSKDYYIDGFIRYLYKLTVSLKLPLLSMFGMKESDAEAICAGTEIKNNPVRLSSAEMNEILTSRI